MANRRITPAEFWRRVKEVHGDRYDYSKSDYAKASLKITVTCRVHGDFDVLAGEHMRGSQCRKCSHVALAERMKGNTVRAMSVPPRALIPAELQPTAEAERAFFIELLEKLRISYAIID